MKVGIISTINTKGQFVIPATIRKKLSIEPSVPLQVSVRGNSVIITPILDVITFESKDSSFIDVLKATKGSWKSDSSLVKSSSKQKIELAASKARKKAW